MFVFVFVFVFVLHISICICICAHMSVSVTVFCPLAPVYLVAEQPAVYRAQQTAGWHAVEAHVFDLA